MVPSFLLQTQAPSNPVLGFLPILLIFAGVLGGMLAFGVIGLFVGPVVLAVTYTLLKSWVERDPATSAPASPAS